MRELKLDTIKNSEKVSHEKMESIKKCKMRCISQVGEREKHEWINTLRYESN